jgi:hypothetical protein
MRSRSRWGLKRFGSTEMRWAAPLSSVHSSPRLVLAVMSVALYSLARAQNPDELVGTWSRIRPVHAEYRPSLVLFSSGKMRIDALRSVACPQTGPQRAGAAQGHCLRSLPSSPGRWSGEIDEATSGFLCLTFNKPKQGGWKSGCRSVTRQEGTKDGYEHAIIEIEQLGLFLQVDSVPRPPRARDIVVPSRP